MTGCVAFCRAYHACIGEIEKGKTLPSSLGHDSPKQSSHHWHLVDTFFT